MADAKKVKQAYIEYLLTAPENLNSVLAFCKKLKIKETDFYDQFNSFEALERSIWKGFFEETMDALNKEKNYEESGAREKVLFFFYTHIEILKNNRSYILYRMKNIKPGFLMKGEDFTAGFRMHLEDYFRSIVAEGMESGEIEQRPIISDYIHRSLIPLWFFVVNYWLKDSSDNFESTDAAIEKSVNLAFQFLGKGILDSVMDFGKFVMQKQSL